MTIPGDPSDRIICGDAGEVLRTFPGIEGACIGPTVTHLWRDDPVTICKTLCRRDTRDWDDAPLDMWIRPFANTPRCKQCDSAVMKIVCARK